MGVASASKPVPLEGAELHFVTQTGIPGEDGRDLSLCLMTQTFGIASFSFWRQTQGYVLSDQACSGAYYFAINEMRLTRAFDTGLIPQETKRKPAMTAGQFLGGFYGLFLTVGFACAISFAPLLIRRRRNLPGRGLDDASSFHRRLLEIMCHAAVADSHVAAAEVKLIRMTAYSYTRKDFSDYEIEQIIKSCSNELSFEQFQAFGEGLTEEDKITAVEAALAVVAADNRILAAETWFIKGLTTGLGIEDEVVGKLTSHLQPVSND
jgi:hypothetical protein